MEDDIFDGNLGENDDEAPMMQIRFFLTDAPLSRQTKDIASTAKAKPEAKVEETKTTTTKKTKGGKTTTTYTTVTRTTDMESSDNFNVKTLKGDLRNGHNQLVDELRAQQTDIFNYEDDRADTLAHLEKVHDELEKEHINDQVFGAELNRLDREVISGIDIHSSQLEDDQAGLVRRIEHVTQKVNEQDPIIKDKNAQGKKLNDTMNKQESIRDKNLSEDATNLRKDNDDLRKKMDQCIKDVKKERDGKVKVFNEHADLVNKYNDLVLKYEKLLHGVEEGRRDAEKNLNATHSEVSLADSDSTNLEHHLNATNERIDNLKNQASSVKGSLDLLSKHYKSFIDQLSKFVGGQGNTIDGLKKDLKKQGDSVADLQSKLTKSAGQIVELHSHVDRENAANLNAKLHTLINTLVEVDKTRRESQNSLENSQEGWTAKLQLFLDEAARMSRQAALDKNAKEIEKMINKLDTLNRDRNEIARAIDEMEGKIITDNNRDAVNANTQKELDGLNLKLRWAEDEINKTRADLDDLLKFLVFKKTFADDQLEQIRSLKTSITEIRTLIEERIVTIRELEEEIRLCDIEIADLKAQIAELDARIAELQDLIADKDQEIEELNRILKERLIRIKQLETELKGSSYVAVKGDMVDELLAQYIKDCPVPVKRLGGGFYLFGLRKIYAKIMNGKLVIRVGGGYMIIEKFIQTYADQELQKLIRVAEREGVSNFMELDLEAIALGPKTGTSPTAGKSPRGTFNSSKKNSSINGTKRTTKSSTLKSGGVTTTTVVTTSKIVKRA